MSAGSHRSSLSVSESRVLLQSQSLFIKMLILFVFKVNMVVQRKSDTFSKRLNKREHEESFTLFVSEKLCVYNLYLLLVYSRDTCWLSPILHLL